jgi:hypothetical protein
MLLYYTKFLLRNHIKQIFCAKKLETKTPMHKKNKKKIKYNVTFTTFDGLTYY